MAEVTVWIRESATRRDEERGVAVATTGEVAEGLGLTFAEAKALLEEALETGDIEVVSLAGRRGWQVELTPENFERSDSEYPDYAPLHSGSEE